MIKISSHNYLTGGDPTAQQPQGNDAEQQQAGAVPPPPNAGQQQPASPPRQAAGPPPQQAAGGPQAPQQAPGPPPQQAAGPPPQQAAGGPQAPQPGINLPPLPQRIKIPVSTASAARNQCLICRKNVKKGLVTLSEQAKLQVFTRRAIFVPKQVRVCKCHLQAAGMFIVMTF